MRSRFKSICRLTLIALAVVAATGSATHAQAQTTLRRIEVVGLQRLSADQVIQTSGLRIGEPISPAQIDAALDRLMQSKLFRGASYRVQIADGDLTVIFQVEENSPGTPPTASEMLGQVRWIDNRVLTAAELSTAFGIKTGESTTRARIENGLEAARKAYARKGYVAARITELRTVDAITRRSNYDFTVREGAQYRMGTLTINGLNPADTKSLKAKWTMAGGAIFDESYLEQFKQTAVRPLVTTLTARNGARSKYDFETKPDAQRLIADVVINFR